MLARTYYEHFYSYSEGYSKILLATEHVMLARTYYEHFYCSNPENSKTRSSKHIDEIWKITKTLIEKTLFSPASTKSFSALFFLLEGSKYVATP